VSHRHTGILSGKDSRNSGKSLTDTLGYSQEETQENQERVSKTKWDTPRKRLKKLRDVLYTRL
jgi:hypothetical protein